MSRAECSLRRLSPAVALIASLLFAACASAPKPGEPLLRKQAQEAEADGAQHYARGNYPRAARSFGAAGQLQQSLDDPAAAARNRLNQARAELASGEAEAALGRTQGIRQPELTLDVLLFQAQVNLALGRMTAVQTHLEAAAAACPANCPQAARLHLLQARAALAGKRAQEALTHAEAALKLLEKKDEAIETGNAWRLIAAARLDGGDASGALPAARAALDIDRQQALPEKIARDWLLIGDIQKKVGAAGTAPAYRRALDVAGAAGLADVARLAAQALADIDNPKEPPR